MLIVYPFVFPPPQVNETVTQQAIAVALIGESKFREDSAGQDGGHWGRGSVKFYRDEEGSVLIELQENFEVGPGPNFWLYFNTNNNVENEDDFLEDEGRVKLHKVKSFKGSQVYKVSEDEFSTAGSLTIWCESFNQYIASTDLPG